MAGVRKGRKEERRVHEAREERTREDRASPFRAHFDFPPFPRPVTQAISNRAYDADVIHVVLDLVLDCLI